MVLLFSGGELVLGEDVPELDLTFGTGGENLTVVGRERDGEDFGVVADESLVGLACSEVPESEGLVPRRGDREGVLLRESEVGHEVVVAGERLVGNAEEAVLLFFEQLPDHDGLVTRAGHEHGRVFVFLLRESGHDGSDPVGVSLEDASLHDFDLSVLSHFSIL